jgi:hypothetical protein
MTNVSLAILHFTHIVGIFIAVGITVGLLLLHKTRLGALLRKHIQETRRRRLLVATFSFFVTFAFTRALTWSIHHNIGPFHDVLMGGRHIHHLVWGIIGLLGIGFAWVLELAEGDDRLSVFFGRFLSLLYGACAALTLDEFALWLNLEDVYWLKEGRESIDAVIIFGSLLLTVLFAMPLLRGIAREWRRSS